jgi:Na+-driven multidrug efflux pump
LVIVFVALVLSGANIVGYYKCSNDQKKKVQNVVQGAAFKTAFGLGTSAVQSFISSTFGQQQQGGGNAEGPHGPPSHV